MYAKRWMAISLLSVIALAGSARSLAAEKEKSGGDAAAAKTETPAKEKGAARVPFHGKLSSVDKAAMTIALEGKERKRVIAITSHTKIVKAGKPATLDEAAPGEEVAGQLVKTAAGKEEAVSLRIGPKPDEAPKKKKAGE